MGDLVIDLDLDGSPKLCENFLKLCKARYYTNTLIYNVTTRFFQAGDPTGTGKGGACILGAMDGDVMKSSKRFLKSQGRRLTTLECREKGRVVATELHGIADTVGSQFLVTLESGEGRALDGYTIDHESERPSSFLSLGQVVEDDDGVLEKIAECYYDSQGRPFADIRIVRALVIHDPFDDPPGFSEFLESRGVEFEGDRVVRSPSPERPPEESVEKRISVTEIEEDDEQDAAKLRQREERALKQEDRGRAVVLEMLGDLPDADIKTPENVLFICKLNPVTVDEDLELIFSRFDEKVKVEVIRDQATGKSLQYAFAEFTNKQQAIEAYFKMNNTLIDDRRIKVDFSQSVAKIWNKYTQKMRMPKAGPGGSFAAAPSGHRKEIRSNDDRGYRERGSHGKSRIQGDQSRERGRGDHQNREDSYRKRSPPDDRDRHRKRRNDRKHSRYDDEHHSRHDDHRSGHRSERSRQEEEDDYDRKRRDKKKSRRDKRRHKERDDRRSRHGDDSRRKRRKKSRSRSRSP